MPNTLACEHCLTPDGWVQDCLIEWDAAGIITRIAPGAGQGGRGLVLPGMPNGHSHAFQRALAGYGERRAGQDSFWSWRDAMYRLAARVQAEDLYLIARQAYTEMLAGGYTSVAEFHYLHHGPDSPDSPDSPDGSHGARGGAATEMAEAVVRAAADAGIAITLLPVCYLTGGFGESPRTDQARFVHRDLDDFLQLLAASRALGVRTGLAVHSLRAVPAELLSELVTGARELLGGDCPIHIHIAEQQREVDACLLHAGRRPIELLADSVSLDRHWNLVHATHALDHELDLIADSGARVVICPLTEAYLGDGLAPAVGFASRGGALAIGSDSNLRLDAVDELRWLEYGQRLRDHARARFADAEGLGARLWRETAAAGAAAVFRACTGVAGVLQVGAPADLVLLDTSRAPLAGLEPDRALDALITSGDRRCIEATWVGGRHVDTSDDAGPAAFPALIRRLMAGL
jgi:formimidoylglutamate deiminase